MNLHLASYTLPVSLREVLPHVAIDFAVQSGVVHA